MVDEKLEPFIELALQYGRGRVSGDWGSKKEDAIFDKASNCVQRLLNNDVDISRLFEHESEFVRYLVAVNTAEDRRYSENAKVVLKDIKARGSHMGGLAALAVDYLKI